MWYIVGNLEENTKQKGEIKISHNTFIKYFTNHKYLVAA